MARERRVHRSWQMWKASVALAFVTLSWIACGGTTTGGGAGKCPASQPMDGTACSGSAECEYTGTQEFCSRITTCGGGVFTHVDGTCFPSHPPCPSTKAQVAVGQACTTSLTCDYPDGRCGCVSPSGPPQIDGGGLSWRCTAPPSGCPTVPPALGTACSMEGQQCDYGACLFGDRGPYSTPLARQCAGGAWARAGVACAK